MKITETNLKGVLILEAPKFGDARGYFSRVFRDNEIDGVDNYPVKEINQSFTYKIGTIRGLHMQVDPMAQDKIIQCLKGEIFDVAVDMRKDSPTYLKWFGIHLTESNNKMLLVPKGFAHGFQSLSPNVQIQYFVSEYFSPEHERGFRFDDPKIGIQWAYGDVSTSDKDATWELL